tara:strand:- start:39865 stop:40098 length:234 start_codon:yes stop_codon:yes gene_type:complete
VQISRYAASLRADALFECFLLPLQAGGEVDQSRSQVPIAFLEQPRTAIFIADRESRTVDGGGQAQRQSIFCDGDISR